MPKGFRLNRPGRARDVAAALHTCQDVKAQQRLLAMRLVASGQLTVAQIAEQVGVSRRQFFNWVRMLKAEGVARLLVREHKVDFLIKQNDFLVVIFASREDAGRQLGEELAARAVQADIVLGVPRGGVIVAAEVARVLQLPLGVLVVRKIGHPRHREFAVGAMAEGDVVLLDQRAVEETHVRPAELREIIAEETERLRAYQSRFQQPGEQILAGKSVVIADDGLATGATAEAAVMSAKKQGARGVIVAVPVASPDAADRLSRVADEVIALAVDPNFAAVGQFYQYFPQTADEEVLALLHPTHA